ncbi:hypothetical protein L2E82_12343 [Cichorium intybus]|uniref:Uncharacterized protein n=1 Tax=Cichorium intybus TaxID=13427 RepID=A0ACB9GFP9_CICIN|nr:hypothetical protein L2E82_12343 [Cichorium intybus]
MLTGVILPSISGCQNLTFLDLHSNSISGSLPASINDIVSLQFVDVSENQIHGTLSPNLGSLTEPSLFHPILKEGEDIDNCVSVVDVDLHCGVAAFPVYPPTRRQPEAEENRGSRVLCR